MPTEAFFYPPSASTDLDILGKSQPLLSLAYVTDGLGDPVADGTAVAVVAWVDKTWTCVTTGFLVKVPPCAAPPALRACSDGTPASAGSGRTTRNGLAVIATAVGPSTTLKEVHWVADGDATGAVTFPIYLCDVSPAPTVCADPNQTCINSPTGDGDDNDRDYIDGMPVLTATPGDGEILWDWSAVASFDARVGIEYGISVVADPSTPSASPTDGFIAATSYLSTGLTNGVEYHARVQAFLAAGSAGIASVPGSISNIASATPAGSAGNEVVLDGVRWRIEG